MSGKQPLYGLGEALRDIRTQRGMTQEQLASELGVRQSTISMIEIGENSPSVELLIRIARALNVTLDSIMEELNRAPTPAQVA
jgi:transcriptional regulator with XRE-family HTH domain